MGNIKNPKEGKGRSSARGIKWRGVKKGSRGNLVDREGKMTWRGKGGRGKEGN